MLFTMIVRIITTIFLLIYGVYPETGIYTALTLGLIAFAIETNSMCLRTIVKG